VKHHVLHVWPPVKTRFRGWESAVNEFDYSMSVFMIEKAFSETDMPQTAGEAGRRPETIGPPGRQAISHSINADTGFLVRHGHGGDVHRLADLADVPAGRD
jgi:hypothetical protein